MPSPHDLDCARARAREAVGRAIGLATWPDVPVRWNRRLRRAGRALVEHTRDGGVRGAIELSPAYFEVYPADLLGILVHETVHVGLALQGRAFGHGPAFRRACLAAGGLLHGKALPGRVYRYRCPVCGQVLERRRLAALDRWCAGCVEEARGQGIHPFARDRALVLVATGYGGPEVDPRWR